MRIATAAKAVRGVRPVRTAPILLLILAVASLESSRSALAALSGELACDDPRFESPCSPRLTELAEQGSPLLRVAQSSGGFFEGLFSIFKPRKPKPGSTVNAESPAVQLKARRSLSESLPGGDGTALPDASGPALPKARSYATFRTMCVRLCDGYYWPVNSGMQSSSIARDQDTCEQSCQSDTRLYVQYSLSADAGDMRDLSGKPYRKLKTAFLYRKTYDPNCKCKPDPWSKVELLRHEAYRAVETGVAIGEPPLPGAESDATDQAVIRDTLASEAETPTDLDLVTGDGSSVGTEPALDAATLAAETLAITRNSSLTRSEGSKESATKPRKTSLPKSATPFLAPADTTARAKK